uniref:Uncharacterized protein n=1 Tax=Rhizophora mucronata TaxID=61149 RepID=A0A2P2NMS3_RHIMU
MLFYGEFCFMNFMTLPWASVDLNVPMLFD